jgi:RNA polymerase sigma-70 factor (ECF subfamily)
MQLTPFRRSPERTDLLVGPVPGTHQPTTAQLEQLFLEAYRRLHGRVLDHAERFLDKEDARDAVADAMQALWQLWPGLPPEKQQSERYVFGMVHHSVFRMLRRNGALVSLDDAEQELDQQAIAAAPDETGRETVADVLDAALAAMPPRRREIFLLVREHSFTYAQAAEALGLAYGTINLHMHLALDDLRAAFTRAGFRIAAPRPGRLPSPKGGAAND